MPAIEPLYNFSECKFAFQLRWGLTIFWQRSVDEKYWFAPVAEQLEPLGIRILSWRWKRAKVSQFAVSTLPQISPAIVVSQLREILQGAIHIRDFKVTLDTENIRARSLEIVTKELLASVVAFNLTMQFRRQAAKLANVEPRRLSFTSCWVVFKDHLMLGQEECFEGWQARYTRALIIAGQNVLPQRKKPRSYPRKAHPRRPKSTKFMKKKIADEALEQTNHHQQQ